MTIHIYNTLTRKKEPFETIEEGKVRMYVCGPTVYSEAHVGHAMSAVVYDIIRRYLEYRGYEVNHVMNYTDVDDKIIIRANQEGRDPIELAETYITEFNHHIIDLNLLTASHYPRATNEIPFIIEMIEGLIEKGHAYKADDGSVYFFVTSDDDYGKLSGRKLEDMLTGTRVAADTRKETQMDFALWKAAKPGEPSWESPWGEGRPGWHIECSAMSLHHLGEQIDIHGGGTDLIFPHHENEIAQSESLTGKPFARYWVHNGMLKFTGEKMSKSLGNLVTIEDFLQDHSADVLRFMVLNSSYRSPLTFNDEVIEQAESAVDRLKSGLKPALPGAGEPEPVELKAQISDTQERFVTNMDDDFNTSGAMAALFDLVKMINNARNANVSDDGLKSAQYKLIELTGVLGLQLEENDAATRDSVPFIDLLVEIRQQLRKEKLWALSDQIRDQLKEHGVIIEDSKGGSTWYWE